MLKQLCAALFVLTLALLVLAPATAKEGRGVIMEVDPVGTGGIGPLNPLLCNDFACQRIVDFLFPKLFATDPKTGIPVAATTDNSGLVTQPALQSGDVQTFTLRDDLHWSDGTPITAYDVFYSLLAAFSLQNSSLPDIIIGAQVVDDHTIAFKFAAPDCSTLPRANFAIAPSHVLDPDFKSFVDTMNRQEKELQPLDVWAKAYPPDRVAALQTADFNQNPTVTAGTFQFSEFRPGQDVRLSAADSAFVYADAPDGISPEDAFLNGSANVMVNPSFDRRADFRARPGLQIAEMPSARWDAIIFNVADPTHPRSAFDDQGRPLDQGHHPIFGDVRVRRAVQMAINTNDLIEAVYDGNATPIASSLPPTSWAFNASLKPSTYDPIGAERLLDSAGWKDVDGDGIRECHGCMYASEGTPLAFSLSVDSTSDLSSAASLITQQLQLVGFAVSSVGSQNPDSQTFDANLSTFYAPDGDPDQSDLFTVKGDVLNASGNLGSYTSPQVESLMQQAATVPGCDPAARAKIYQQIQSILQDDQPYAFLYAENDMVVAKSGVIGFAPLAGNPFWNIRDWVVTP